MPAAKTKKKNPRRKEKKQPRVNRPIKPITSESLTDMQVLFIKEYCIDKNASAAAVRAGYSDSNYGPQLLMYPNIRRAINQSLANHSQKLEATTELVLLEQARVAFSDIKDIFDCSGPSPILLPIDEIPVDTRRAISGIKVRRSWEIGKNGEPIPVDVIEYKFWNKDSALEKLGKHLGLFPDRHEITGKVDHQHSLARATLDSLSLETRCKILEELRSRHEQKLLPDGVKEVVDG